MSLSRRGVIRNTAIGVGVLAVGNVQTLFAGGEALAAPARSGGGDGDGTYGRLVPDPAGILDLPPGFAYRIVSKAGSILANGKVLPDRFDGTGAFAGPSNTTRLVRNHELSGAVTASTVAAAAGLNLVYDPGASGGTSTLVLDDHGNTIDEYVSLAGTYNNCAGGVTPWGTWLSCEETEVKKNATRMKDHGFVFEVDPNEPARNENPTPLYALGRFPHEAACIDPATGAVYLTEDASSPNGLVYKCVPANPAPGYGNLRAGGALFAMACFDGDLFVPDLSVYTTPSTELGVQWVHVPDPLAAFTSTRRQFDVGANTMPLATRSRKFEGAWWADGRAHVVCSFARITDDSLAEHDGQVWSHDPAASTLTLEVRFDVNAEPSGAGADLPDGPDNITVSPWGGLVLCEDGDGVNHLLAVAPDGSTSLFARNHANDSEFTGATFSPDRHTLFTNVQQPGVTFSITGPFARVNRHRPH